jgi:hypothetical protein
MQDPHDDIHASSAHGNANRMPKGPAMCSPSAPLPSAPLVSIALPVHNGEAFLDECLQGIAAQTHRPLEVVVCNNGSTDTSGAILAAWQPRLEALGISYTCVTTGPEDPRGCGYGRNRCIEAASGAPLYACESWLHTHLCAGGMVRGQTR